jgi:hypothetical protein
MLLSLLRRFTGRTRYVGRHRIGSVMARSGGAR